MHQVYLPLTSQEISVSINIEKQVLWLNSTILEIIFILSNFSLGMANDAGTCLFRDYD